jgi:hypothetical protein
LPFTLLRVTHLYQKRTSHAWLQAERKVRCQAADGMDCWDEHGEWEESGSEPGTDSGWSVDTDDGWHARAGAGHNCAVRSDPHTQRAMSFV